MPTSSSTCLVGLPPQWHGSTGGRSIGSKPLQEPERRWSLREVDRLICLFPFLMWREEGLVTVLSSKGFRVMSPESTLTSTSRGRGSNMLSLLLPVVSTLWAAVTMRWNCLLRLCSLQARWMTVAAVWATL